VPQPPPPPPLTPAEEAAEAGLEVPAGVQPIHEGDDDGDTADRLVVQGMEVELLDEVWTWQVKKQGADWVLDYSNETQQVEFLRPSSPLSFMGIEDDMARAYGAAGLDTIDRLATAEKDVIVELKLDEFGDDVCRQKKIAEALMLRCQVQPVVYDGEFIHDLEIVEGDAAAQDFALEEAGGADDDAVEVEIPDEDGCGMEVFEGLVPVEDDDVDRTCRWSMAPRRSMGCVTMDGIVYNVGGYEGSNVYANDVWYRDDKLPQTLITLKPVHQTSQTVFQYSADEPNTLFEYRFVELDEDTLQPTGGFGRNWTLSTGEVDFLEFLDGGFWTFQVRAVDAAGNPDPVYEEGRNAYTWEYIPALPWGLIIGLILTFLALLSAGLLEWRRRRRKAAMERYAMRRMRRKFKGIQQGAQGKELDWKSQKSKKSKDKKKKKKKGKGDKKKKGKDKKKSSGKKSTAGGSKKPKKSKTKDGGKKSKKAKTSVAGKKSKTKKDGSKKKKKKKK